MNQPGLLRLRIPLYWKKPPRAVFAPSTLPPPHVSDAPYRERERGRPDERSTPWRRITAHGRPRAPAGIRSWPDSRGRCPSPATAAFPRAFPATILRKLEQNPETSGNFHRNPQRVLHQSQTASHLASTGAKYALSEPAAGRRAGLRRLLGPHELTVPPNAFLYLAARGVMKSDLLV